MALSYTPNTAVHLCNVPLNINNKNQYCPNGWTRAAQTAWFNAHTVQSYNYGDFTYQRKDGIIRVPVNAEYLYSRGVNYCYYCNSHYGDKIFYCYIERIEFLNENTTALHIKTDVFQTWLFDMTLKTSFVARQTVLNDDLFKHTLPEPLPTPEYVIKESHSLLDINGKNPLTASTPTVFNQNYWCVVVTSEKLKYLSSNIPGNVAFMGGVPSPSYWYACDLGEYYSFMDNINKNGQVDAVVSCMAIPKFMVDFTELSQSPIPPDPDPPTPQPSIPENYLGSPYASAFYVTQTWNPPNHWGIDLDNNDDLNLYATTDGIVVAAAFHGYGSGASGHGFGKTVVIKSTTYSTSEPWQYYYFMYCHMDSMSVQPGQTVTRGQHIGVQGETGQSDGSHCHYEVQIHGNIQPMQTGEEIGNNFGHDVISQSQSVNPTIFASFPNQEGYYS